MNTNILEVINFSLNNLMATFEKLENHDLLFYSGQFDNRCEYFGVILYICFPWLKIF